VLVEPLSPPDARRLIREILQSGSVVLSRHAAEEVIVAFRSETELRVVTAWRMNS
jgi:hypothetical protein